MAKIQASLTSLANIYSGLLTAVTSLDKWDREELLGVGFRKRLDELLTVTRTNLLLMEQAEQVAKEGAN